MQQVVEGKIEQLEKYLQAAETGFSESQHRSVLSIIDMLSRKREGLEYLYNNVEQVLNAGFFNGTNWADPNNLVPSLVKGTLMSGVPLVTFETLSELRMLKIASGEWKLANYDRTEAEDFLKETLVDCLDLVFDGSSEQERNKMSTSEYQRLRLLFEFILEHISLSNIKQNLAQEVAVRAAQRPIQTKDLERILILVKKNLDLSAEDEHDLILLGFIDALFHPSPESKKAGSQENYLSFLESTNLRNWRVEAAAMGEKLKRTGLVSIYTIILLKFLTKKEPALIGEALGLSSHGKADLERHQAFTCEIIDRLIFNENKEVAYGLSKLLNRNLLSRTAVWNALNKLIRIDFHPNIQDLLDSNIIESKELSASAWLCGGAISLLGQPLGVGQGRNPTCQSARGLSMWSRHSPEKLLNMIIAASTADELRFRYEGDLIKSNKINFNKEFDFNLDPVSLVLVPHLDSIYGQMMQRAAVKYPHKDPHASVNPAFYGHWIQTGFTSCYNATLNAIKGFDYFVKLFFAAFHPEFNGGHNLIYPNPLGIFITSAQGEFIGFHAVSLLRVKQDERGVWRAYFFNPNNEGRQDWGQGIRPAVNANGEKHGESSLPFYQFASRVYAYNYNSVEAKHHLEEVPPNEVKKVENLAKNSWGKQYIWL